MEIIGMSLAQRLALATVVVVLWATALVRDLAGRS